MAFIVDDILGGGDDFPDYQAPTMDPNAKSFVDQTIANRPKHVESAYDRAIKAAQGAQGLMPTLDSASRTETAMGRTNSQTQAILTKGQNSFSSNIQKMMLQNQIDAEKAKAGALNSSFQLSNKQLQLFNQIKQARLLSEQNKIAARNQVIREIFSAGGVAAGMAIAGPAGGLAANQIANAMNPRGGGPMTMADAQIGMDNSMADFESRKWRHKDYNLGEF